MLLVVCGGGELNVGVVEQPYEPLFPLPDYKTVGKTLLDLAYVGLRDDSAERFYAADIEAVVDTKELLEESEVKLELKDIRTCTPLRLSPRLMVDLI